MDESPIFDFGADNRQWNQMGVFEHNMNNVRIDSNRNRYILKKVNKLGPVGFSDVTIIFPLPLSFAVSCMPTVFMRSGLRARGTKVGLISSIGNKVMGHTSPSASRLANVGSIYL